MLPSNVWQVAVVERHKSMYRFMSSTGKTRQRQVFDSWWVPPMTKWPPQLASDERSLMGSIKKIKVRSRPDKVRYENAWAIYHSNADVIDPKFKHESFLLFWQALSKEKKTRMDDLLARWMLDQLLLT